MRNKKDMSNFFMEKFSLKNVIVFFSFFEIKKNSKFLLKKVFFLKSVKIFNENRFNDKRFNLLSFSFKKLFVKKLFFKRLIFF